MLLSHSTTIIGEAPMELKLIQENVYYIPHVTNIGIIKTGDSAILIDSSVDDDTARKILKLLENHHLQPKAIINTHFHADHCGGNAYIKNKTNATIYAPEIEADFIQHPYLQPFVMFSGADPPKDLQNKLLMQAPSKVDHVIKSEEKLLQIEGIEVEIVRLPGHSPNQIGIGTGNVLFCADSIFSLEILAKHKIPYLCDVGKQQETLTTLKTIKNKHVVPSHGEPTRDVTQMVDAYTKFIEETETYLTRLLSEEKRTDQILKALCEHYQVEIKLNNQYFLMNTITLAYLSHLRNKGQLTLQFKENILYWKTTTHQNASD